MSENTTLTNPQVAAEIVDRVFYGKSAQCPRACAGAFGFCRTIKYDVPSGSASILE